MKIVRPALANPTNIKIFKNFYWTKQELIVFCKKNGLQVKGGKIELSHRIECFLATGKIEKSPLQIRCQGKWDSEQGITKNTPVINYKNDAKTKLFFLENIGLHFHFNAYLRQFSKIPNINCNLTYGNLIEGWLKSEADKKSFNKKPPIEKQFQFNQFQRDFYATEKGKNRKQMIDAWKMVRSVPGSATYAHYVFLSTLMNPV
ncbi:MAG TPA: SAP domain-containing protein [Gammaproteobacteria bacterium]|nr:SAP domain-containing protein [Gammaproteobacteria bacterium]